MIFIYWGSQSQHVGIGTTVPQARLHVVDSSVLFSADGDVVVARAYPPLSGAGRRMMWVPQMAAFRVGHVVGTQWDRDNIGAYSIGLGNNITASGFSSTAMGTYTTASGDMSLATGYSTTASGYASTATGAFTTASSFFSTAMGFGATSSRLYSFCIGGSKLPTVNTTDSQMMMRFSNYTFWVTPSSYAYLVPASNGWAYTSDKNKKERFEELNGEAVLQKISTIPFYSWNFKDTKQYRHYGIMAQDFFNAFGKDSYGDIGNDTTVSPLDLLGVNMAATKALEKRSTALAKENEQLKQDNLLLRKELVELKGALEKSNSSLQNKLAFIEKKLEQNAPAPNVIKRKQ